MKILQLIFRANLDAYAANTAPADILEFFLHVAGAFFGVVVALAVRFGELAKDCARRASAHTRRTFAATVFDDLARRSKGHVRNHGRKTDFTSVLFGQEKSALSDETESRKYRRGLVGDKPCITAFSAQALRCGNGCAPSPDARCGRVQDRRDRVHRSRRHAEEYHAPRTPPEKLARRLPRSCGKARTL